jgi:hypothetical protein
MYFKNCAIMKRWRKKTGSTTEFCIAEDGGRGGEGKVKVKVTLEQAMKQEENMKMKFM